MPPSFFKFTESIIPIILSNLKNNEENVKYLQGIIDQHEATIKRMQERIDGEADKFNQKCQHCEKLERELAVEKNINRIHQEYRDIWSKKGPLVTLNVSGSVDIKKDDQGVEMINLPAIIQETPLPIVVPPLHTETFSDRLKSIFRIIATKNGQIIECRAKGHSSSYIYHVNDTCFCKALDVLVAEHTDKLIAFLGGNLHNTQVTKICFFIGHVLRMNIINAPTLQIADVLFAFNEYYPSKKTLSAKLSDKSSNQEQKVLMGIFEGLLRRFIS
jgi:hypothetical protein